MATSGRKLFTEHEAVHLQYLSILSIIYNVAITLFVYPSSYLYIYTVYLDPPLG